MNRIHVYTGDGKGKTTASLGLLLRFLGGGGKAWLIQFDKGSAGEDFYGERRILSGLPGLSLHATGLPRFIPERKTFRFQNVAGDLAEARRGLELARQALRSGAGLVVLDEILSLLLTGLAQEADLDALLDDYLSLGRPCELVLTGHKTYPALEAKADLITRMQKVKHYFESGEDARKGIEF